MPRPPVSRERRDFAWAPLGWAVRCAPRPRATPARRARANGVPTREDASKGLVAYMRVGSGELIDLRFGAPLRDESHSGRRVTRFRASRREKARWPTSTSASTPATAVAPEVVVEHGDVGDAAPSSEAGEAVVSSTLVVVGQIALDPHALLDAGITANRRARPDAHRRIAVVRRRATSTSDLRRTRQRRIRASAS